MNVLGAMFGRSRGGEGRRRRPARRPELEGLEGRVVLSTATITDVAASDGIIDYGQAETLKAAVAATGTTARPPGSIQFFVDGAKFGAPVPLNSVDLAQVVTSGLGAGYHKVSAGYLPSSASFLASNAAAPASVGVAPAQLTVAANSAGKLYGAALPALSATYTGFVNGDSAAGLTGKLQIVAEATAGSPVGSYPIYVGGVGSPNYQITFRAATLAVMPAPLTVSANIGTKVYGAAVPTLTATYGGLVNGDTPTRLSGKLQEATNATATSPVGTYLTTIGGLYSSNYTITFKAAPFNVTPAPLEVIANSLTSTVGDPPPTLSANFIGLVNGDTVSGLGGKLQLLTTATTTSPAGLYPIYVGGVGSPNYTITFVAGTLTLKPKA